MATSKCPKCDDTSFELVEANIRNNASPKYFVQCSSCGAVVNTIEYFATTDLFKSLEKKIDLLVSLLQQ